MHPLTFNFAKGLYHVRNAKHYFEHIKAQKEVVGKAKDVLHHQINRLEGILKDFRLSLPPDTAKILEAEMESDTMVFEAINDKLCLLSQEDRWEVEEFINAKIANKKQIILNENDISTIEALHCLVDEYAPNRMKNELLQHSSQLISKFTTTSPNP